MYRLSHGQLGVSSGCLTLNFMSGKGLLFDTLLADLSPFLHSDRCAMIAVTPNVYMRACVHFLFPAQAPSVELFPAQAPSVDVFPSQHAQAPCVDAFPSYSLLKLLLWMRSLPIPSFCGCVPFLFPAQAPSVAVFNSSPCSSSFCAFLFLLWPCSLPSTCSAVTCTHCSVCLWTLQQCLCIG